MDLPQVITDHGDNIATGGGVALLMILQQYRKEIAKAFKWMGSQRARDDQAEEGRVVRLDAREKYLTKMQNVLVEDMHARLVMMQQRVDECQLESKAFAIRIAQLEGQNKLQQFQIDNLKQNAAMYRAGLQTGLGMPEEPMNPAP